MKNYLLFILFFFTYSFTKAQCGNIFMVKENEIEKLETYRYNLLKSTKTALNNSNQRITDNQDTIRIPIVFNILFSDSVADEKLFNKSVFQEIIDSTNMILNIDLEKIIAMNRAEYHDILAVPYIQLMIARLDPAGNPTDGFRYKKWTVPNGSEFCEFPWITGQQKAKLNEFGGISAWDNKNYLNFWVGNFRQGGGCYGGQSTYPSFPFLPGQLLNFMDGILVQDYLVKGNHRSSAYFSTFAHELGHYLGLIHIWGGIIDDSQEGCNIDDGIVDTPNQFGAHYSCNTITNSCIDAANDKNDMCSNIMDYADGISFTKGQVDVMRSSALNIRKDLTIPKVEANLQISATDICVGNSVTLKWIDVAEQKSDFLFPSWDLNTRNLTHTFTPANDTTFIVFLTNAYDTIFQNISIHIKSEMPVANFSIPDTVLLSDTLTIDFANIDSIYSDINFIKTGNTISFSPTHSENNKWIYFQNQCFKDSIFISYIIEFPTSIKNKIAKSVKIFPNPAKNNIQIDTKQQYFDYAIYNTKSKIIQQGIYNNQINISKLSKGIYILTFLLNGEIYSAKFEKE